MGKIRPNHSFMYSTLQLAEQIGNLMLLSKFQTTFHLPTNWQAWWCYIKPTNLNNPTVQLKQSQTLSNKMGVLVPNSSLGSQNFTTNSHHKNLNFLSSIKKERASLHFKCSTSILSSKLDLIDVDERTSPIEVKKEIQRCYELIQRLGRGVVYLGSSRMGAEHSHFKQTQELGREVAKLLGCTSWSGAGPGLMDAVTLGAMEAGKAVGGFKIAKEAGDWTATNFHPYLPPDTYYTCRFFSARKHGLVDAAVRTHSTERTAVVALPGGIGTLDEIFEILVLIQLDRIGSVLPVPFLLMNYDSFYSKLLEFLDDCKEWGTVADGEFTSLCKVCDNNSQALAYLAEFYHLSTPQD